MLAPGAPKPAPIDIAELQNGFIKEVKEGNLASAESIRTRLYAMKPPATVLRNYFEVVPEEGKATFYNVELRPALCQIISVSTPVTGWTSYLIAAKSTGLYLYSDDDLKMVFKFAAEAGDAELLVGSSPSAASAMSPAAGAGSAVGSPVGSPSGSSGAVPGIISILQARKITLSAEEWKSMFIDISKNLGSTDGDLRCKAGMRALMDLNPEIAQSYAQELLREKGREESHARIILTAMKEIKPGIIAAAAIAGVEAQRPIGFVANIEWGLRRREREDRAVSAAEEFVAGVAVSDGLPPAFPVEAVGDGSPGVTAHLVGLSLAEGSPDAGRDAAMAGNAASIKSGGGGVAHTPVPEDALAKLAAATAAGRGGEPVGSLTAAVVRRVSPTAATAAGRGGEPVGPLTADLEARRAESKSPDGEVRI